MDFLRRLAPILGALATLAPLAHVLELPNKLALPGPLWLGIQQNLYRGWGPLIGAPTEIAALAVSVALCFQPRERNAAIVATVTYAGMLAAFFVFNAPVNAALNGWTAETLPPDWSDYRLRWELGHAIAAILAVTAFLASLRQTRFTP